MNNPLTRRALLALSHPLSIAALFILLLNDHWLKKVAPSWLTGKLSDVAGLVFVPFVLLVVLAFVLPHRYRKHERDLGWLALFITGGAFALIKTLPVARDAAAQLFESVFGWPIIIRIDLTDLLALPALLIAWHIWEQSATTVPTPKRGWPLLALSTVALVATSPLLPNLGVYCLRQTETDVTAYTSSGLFVSEDGGSTWRFVERLGGIAEGCTPFLSDARELADPDQPDVRYRITPHQSIEGSVDGGQTWQTELASSMTEAQMEYYHTIRPKLVELIGVPRPDPGPYDAVVDQQAGTLIAAMGQEGVAVRTSTGQWHYVAVGPYARVDLSLPENMVPVLQWELLAAIALAFLMLATMSGRHTTVWPDVLLLVAWVVWTMQLLAIVPGDDNMLLNWDALHEIGLIVTSVIAVPLAIVQTWTLWGTARHALYAALAFTAAAVVLFVFIYWLWSQGSIPLHQTATFLALGEVFVLVVAGLLVINVNPSAPAVARVSVDKSHTE
jgi:hypothetical protein